jgi:hypothetical protein
MSGLPGRLSACKRYRYPAAVKALRTAISGRVSLRLLPRIAALAFGLVGGGALGTSRRCLAAMLCRLSISLYRAPPLPGAGMRSVISN